MRRFLVSLFAVVVACSVGGIAGFFVSGYIQLRKLGERLQFVEETYFVRSGERAFHSYQNEQPEIGVFALRYHLDELERYLPATNGATVHAIDVEWWKALAHARLSLTYAKIGEQSLSSNEIDVAVKFLSRQGPRGLPTNGADLRRYVEHADKKRSWL